MTVRETTRELGDLIHDEFLIHGTGQLDVLVDDIVTAFRKHHGGSVSLKVADRMVKGRLGSALNYLWEERRWLGVPVTDFYFRAFVDTERTIDDADVTEQECKASVAGLGRAQARVGYHFITNKDDWLFVFHAEHGVKNGHGKVRANLERAIGQAESGNLSIEAAATIYGPTAMVEEKRRVKQLTAAAR